MSAAIIVLNQAYFLRSVPVIMCFAVVFTLFSILGAIIQCQAPKCTEGTSSTLAGYFQATENL